MSDFVEKLFDALFALVNGYESMRARPSDDPLTEEYKGLQRSVMASFLWTFGSIIAGLGAAGVLSSLEGNATFGQLAAAARAPIDTLILGALGLTSLWFIVAVGRLYLFIRKYGLAQ